MKSFLILLAIGFGNSDKLDLKYLPPPGSELADGSPGTSDIPLRLPIPSSTTVPSVLTEMTSLVSLINDERQIGSKADKKVKIKTPLKLIDASIFNGDNTKLQSNNSRPEMLTDNSYPNRDFNGKSIYFDEFPHSHTEDISLSGIFKQNNIDKPVKNEGNDINLLHPVLHRGRNQSNKNIKSLIHKSEKVVENHTSKYYNNDLIQDYLINEFSTEPNYTFTPMEKMYENKLILPYDHSQTDSTISISKSSSPRRPQANLERNAFILNYKNIVKPDEYTYTFDTSNGIHVNENGTVINGASVQGSYSYTGDDGKIYSVTYTADENGFQPRGEHLPTSPPIPEAILKVIEQAAKDKEAGIFDDGSYDENKYGYKSYQNIINDDKKLYSESIFFVNGADIPNNEFDTNILENNIFPYNDVEMQNKPDKQYSQENKVSFNRNISNINFKALENKTKIGVTEKQLIEDIVTLPEESFEREFSPDPKKILRSQIMIDSVYKKVLSNKNIHPVENEKKTAEDVTVTTLSEKSAITNKGYFYIQPQRKFNELENRFLESEYFISERKKNVKTSENKDKKPQPFITPNVSRDYEGSQEDNSEQTEASVRNFDLSDKLLPKLDQKLSRKYHEIYPPIHSNIEIKVNNETDISIHNVTEQFGGKKHLDITYPFSGKSSQITINIDKNQNVYSNRSSIYKEYYQPSIISSITESLTELDSMISDVFYSSGAQYSSTEPVTTYNDEILNKALESTF
ncbi:unnamed protein product [Parnassius apollo]|uniref:(apollo) hypothetical protein n=1 Tax=Parnassius apollo TaxID=110799 RepID=A0A8S3XE23_PARAO|nr:unnamed protein product [Parnassius apollo]